MCVVGRYQIPHIKILAPWAKEAQNGGEKGGNSLWPVQ